MDMMYIENYSVFKDVQLLFQTAIVLLKSDSTEESMENVTTNVGIYFSNAEKITCISLSFALNNGFENDFKYVKEMRDEYNKRRVFLVESFRKLGFEVFEPEGAFYVFVDVTDTLNMTYKGNKIETAAEFARILIDEYNVAVVPCADFGFENHIRLSYAISVEQIDKGVTRIEQFLSELK